jgi:hypothetical protein
MKVGHLILFLSLAAVGFSAHGQYDEDSMGMGSVSKDLLAKITKAQGSLRNLSETKDCKFPENPDCTTKSLCEGITANADSLYLYKNAEGKGVPNVFLFQVNDALEGCFKTKAPNISDDPFFAPEKFLKNSQAWQQEEAKNKNLFEDTKNEIVRMLESRKDGKNNKDMDVMIRRIQTVKMAPIAGHEAEYLTKASCNLPNAAYDYNTHTLLVCPQLYRYPQAALETVLAHELGHSIDPCLVGGDLKQTSDGIVTELSHQEKVPGKVLVPGIAYDANPFKKNVLQCLQQKNSMGVTSKPLADYEDEIMMQVQETESYANDGSEDPGIRKELEGLKKQQNEMKSTYKYQQACSWFKKSGDAQETFADWVAAQVKRAKVSQIKDPAKAKTYALESEGIFLSYSCGEVKQRVLSKVLSQFDTRDRRQVETRCYDMVRMIGGETHPEGAQRIDKLHLAVPEIQKALGCKPDKTVPDCK